jgi:hypothetical protein
VDLLVTVNVRGDWVKLNTLMARREYLSDLLDKATACKGVQAHSVDK